MNGKATNEFERVNCALCNCDETVSFIDDRRFHLVKCRRCGLVYINPRPTQEDLSKIYNVSVQGRREIMDSIGYTEFADIHILKSKKFLNIVKRYKRKGRLLDIGCATGFFLNLAKHQGFEPFGTDVSKAFCRFAKRKFNLQVFCGTLREASYPNEYFDVVTMFDVLSHLPTPVEELREVNRILRKEGLLLIETGNRGELNPKAIEVWGGVWGSPGHLYHFGTETLIRLLETTGFDCLDVDKTPIVLSSIMEIALRRIAGSRKSKDVSYQQLKLGPMPTIAKRGLAKTGAHLYILSKYTLGRLLPKASLDCTIIACSQKR